MKPTCTVCGSDKRRKNGTIITRQGTFQKWLCLGCGHQYRGELIKAHSGAK